MDVHVAALVVAFLAPIIGYCDCNVVQFREMFIFVLPEMNPYAASSYGHYCGLGGNGTSVDGFDECCKIHDACYGEASPKCYKVHGALIKYQWFKGTGKKPICEIKQKDCAFSICKCDSDIVLCFKKHQEEFNETNIRDEEASWMDNLGSKLRRSFQSLRDLKRALGHRD